MTIEELNRREAFIPFVWECHKEDGGFCIVNLALKSSKESLLATIVSSDGVNFNNIVLIDSTGRESNFIPHKNKSLTLTEAVAIVEGSFHMVSVSGAEFAINKLLGNLKRERLVRD